MLEFEKWEIKTVDTGVYITTTYGDTVALMAAYGGNKQDQLTNARLIATAPEMHCLLGVAIPALLHGSSALQVSVAKKIETLLAHIDNKPTGNYARLKSKVLPLCSSIELAQENLDKYAAMNNLAEYKEISLMTLDEAIEHALDVAENSCGSCAENHRQLANWLIELKKIKEKEYD